MIGAQPGSWAAVAHLPALASLDDEYRVAGIANSSAASAANAARALGVLRAFASVEDLIVSSEVDLVAITVKVPHHADLVRLALASGKHVLCEWPLARTLAEAEDLATLAASSGGLVAAVGTQAVFAPAISGLAGLIRDGTLGSVLSSSIVGAGMTWGATIEQRNVYLLDAGNGATMLTIAVGHALSAVEATLGRIAAVSATLATRRRSVAVRETGEQVTLAAPDQILLACTLENGTPLSLHYRGGPPREEGLVWNIDGSDGSARITSSSGLLEMAPLTLQVSAGATKAWETRFEPVDRPAVDGVRRLYSALADKIRGGQTDVPDFSTALRLHRIIAAIEESAVTERRVVVGD
ncbi:MAG: Gfo/Idh/MocA family oxidoreductase [Pseudomonadota bacterium]